MRRIGSAGLQHYSILLIVHRMAMTQTYCLCREPHGSGLSRASDGPKPQRNCNKLANKSPFSLKTGELFSIPKNLL